MTIEVTLKVSFVEGKRKRSPPQAGGCGTVPRPYRRRWGRRVQRLRTRSEPRSVDAFPDCSSNVKDGEESSPKTHGPPRDGDTEEIGAFLGCSVHNDWGEVSAPFPPSPSNSLNRAQCLDPRVGPQAEVSATRIGETKSSYPSGSGRARRATSVLPRVRKERVRRASLTSQAGQDEVVTSGGVQTGSTRGPLRGRAPET